MEMVMQQSLLLGKSLKIARTMLVIYADKFTIRLDYTLSIIFEDRGVAYRLIDNKATFEKIKGPKLVYSNDRTLQKYTQLSPSNLLFDEGIKKYNIEKSKWNGEEILSFDGVPDVLASLFYIVALYDDYLQEEKDNHNRNIGKNSLLYRMGWLDKLVVERWSEAFIKYIETENDYKLMPRKIPMSTVPTFDIDHAYAYKLRKGWRKYLSILRDVLTLNRVRLKERKEVLKGNRKDPYDTFDLIEEIAETNDVRVFWLLGNYATFDKNVSNRSFAHHDLIRRMDENIPVGLHPSYNSNYLEGRLNEEKDLLERILNRGITHSRQHFLKVKLPETYRKLQIEGFLDDYSLAYADHYGFRAGIARPFMWFDIKKNQVSVLKLHPATFMDGTLKEYMQLTPEQAIEVVQKLKKEVQIYGGDFIGIWHNETIGDYGAWQGWSAVLEEMLKS